MDEKLICQVNQLSMDQPRVDLVEEHFVADVENAGKHVLDHGVSTHTALMEGVKELPTT